MRGCLLPTDCERSGSINADRARQRLAARSPRVIGVSARRHARDCEYTFLVRDRKERRVNRHDVGSHVRMDIAEETRETWLIEDDPLDAAGRIHPEIEFLPVAKREHV